MNRLSFGLLVGCLWCLFSTAPVGAEAVSVAVKQRQQGKSAPYSPRQATGEPDVPAAGDNPLAWTPLQPDGAIEWLTVVFDKAVRIDEVRIRESNNPGCVTKVVALVGDDAAEKNGKAKDNSGGEGDNRDSGDEQEVVLFEGEDPSDQAPADFVIEPINAVRSKAIKIYVDTRLKPGWEQIDAVELVGKDGSRQWAVDASASSSFGGNRPWGAASRAYHPEQATGEPNVGDAGDSGLAWAPATMDGGIEWLQLNFRAAARVAEVRIRESFNPGAIVKVVAIAKGDKQKNEVVLWEGDETAAADICDFVVKPDREIESQSIRVYLDPSRVASWPEIDAVQLVGRDGRRQWASTASASSSFGSPQGNQDELGALRGKKVQVSLDGGSSIGGELIRVGAKFIVIKGETGRERLINRDKIVIVEPAAE